MTDQEKKRIALAGIAAWLVVVANGTHALAVQDAGVWSRFCPVWNANR